jgi:NosR/NirI family transcriptional regulator, nitrous oxide reductase regulator
MKLKTLKLKKFFPYILIILLFLWHSTLFAQQRFPRPEFETGYNYPGFQMPLQRGPVWEYFDAAVLVAVLSVTAWLAIKKRSRQGIIMVSLFSIAYFGFYRQGCICSVGSVQNVSLALFNHSYSIPVSALLFFTIPLFFALFFGRVFCAGACPLGAIQELTGFMPVNLPRPLEAALASVPFIYLALSVLFSATNSQFIICRYDPFIGIFRLNAPVTMIVFGVLLLLAGIFVNRPYCRFLCPYGVLLGIFSRFAPRHLSITPAECTNCRLCEESCPYNAIIPSDNDQKIYNHEKLRKQFMILVVLIPLLAAAGGVLFYNLAPALSVVNSKVRLAREIRLEKETGLASVSKRAAAFMESGKTEEELFSEEASIVSRFRKSSPWAGIFLGASLGIALVSLTIRSRRTEYKPDQGKCYSCGRCFKYCPVKLPV